MPSTFGTVPPLSIFSLRPNLWLFKRLDALGALMLTSTSLLLVTVLNETNLAFEWSSGTAIALLVLSGALWIAFFCMGVVYARLYAWVGANIPETLFLQQSVDGDVTVSALKN
jgi:hypothetical protein